MVGTSAFANDPYPFQLSDGMLGYFDDSHSRVIEPQFDLITMDFLDSRAAFLSVLIYGQSTNQAASSSTPPAITAAAPPAPPPSPPTP
jgi:hypothetical protein